jgi:hypothetical protein
MKNIKAKNRLRSRLRAIFLKPPTFKFFAEKIGSYVVSAWQCRGLSATYDLWRE